MFCCCCCVLFIFTFLMFVYFSGVEMSLSTCSIFLIAFFTDKNHVIHLVTHDWWGIDDFLTFFFWQFLFFHNSTVHFFTSHLEIFFGCISSGHFFSFLWPFKETIFVVVGEGDNHRNRVKESWEIMKEISAMFSLF